VKVDDHLLYYFDLNLTFLRLEVTDTMKRIHGDMYRDGKLDHELSSAEIKSWENLVFFEAVPDGNSEAVEAMFNGFVPNIVTNPESQQRR